MEPTSRIAVLYVGAETGLVRAITDGIGTETTVVTERPPVADVIDQLSAGSFDCVVCDDELPDGDWLTVQRTVRESAPSLPFILLVSDDTVVNTALDAGITDYVLLDAEPEPSRALARRVAHAAEQYQPRHELCRFREVVEQAGHAVYITDADGTIEYVNPAFEESTGYSYEEVLGKNPNILNSGEHSSEFYASLWNTILSGNVWKGEVINERKNGQRYVVEQTVAPIEGEGEGEEADRFVAINTDITQRKAYEQKLEQYEAIMENLPVGVFRTTPGDDGKFVEVNSTLVSIYDAYSKSELLKRSVSEFYADSEARAEISRQLREEGTITGLEVDQKTLAGEQITVSLTAMKSEEDGDVYFDGILQDITQRKHRERELERKNEQLEQFASIVTHDLRNPLNVAQSRLELTERVCENDGIQDNLDVIDEQLVRMEELIEDVLAIARHGQQVEETEPVNLGTLVEGCWQSVQTDGAELIVDTDLTVSVDTSRAQQLFENLFRNAIEHGGSDVTVRVGTLTDGFYVEDDGAGIDPAEQDSVFDHGYTTDTSGTGFGLNIVREIVDAHGWDISATTGTRGGARFEITGIGTGHK